MAPAPPKLEAAAFPAGKTPAGDCDGSVWFAMEVPLAEPDGAPDGAEKICEV